MAAFQLRCHTLAEHLPRIWVLVDLDVLVNCGVHTHKKPRGVDVKKKTILPSTSVKRYTGALAVRNFAHHELATEPKHWHFSKRI